MPYKLTLHVDSEDTVKAAKIICIRRGTNIGKVVSEALERYVAGFDEDGKTKKAQTERGSIQADSPSLDP